MDKLKVSLLAVICIHIAICGASSEESDDVVAPIDDMVAPPNDDLPGEEVQPEKLDYAKGSVCGYCTYCEFCSLCDQDCPCETSPSKPNCKMCKYCKYCHLCSAVCDTVCTPGGILDRVTGAIVNSLPAVDHNEVNEDLDTVRHYINKKDEL